MMARKLRLRKRGASSKITSLKASTDITAAEPLSLLRSVREHRRFYLLFSLVAVALAMLFVFVWPTFVYDSAAYGNIALNWLQRGIYGISGPNDVVNPTLIRLPGYPGFLAICFVLFGREHYHAVMFIQIFFHLLTCFLIADIAGRTAGERVARVAFALSASCVFFANYAAAILTESLAIFFTALALDAAIAAMDVQRSGRTATRHWIGCGLALCAGTYLRPDGGMLLMAIAAYLLLCAVRRRSERWPNVGAA